MNHININLLLSDAEYLALPENIKLKVPYLYSFEHSNQTLYYFGARHVMNPEHPQNELLHKKWQDFLTITKNRKSIVIYEGSVNVEKLTSIDQAIREYGESGAIIYWARIAQIPFFRPELTINEETRELLKKFDREYVFFFYMLRGIATWNRKTPRENFDDFIKRNIQRYQRELSWSDFDFSFENAFLMMHKKIFGKEFNLEDEDFLTQIKNLSFSELHINEVAKESCRVRDESILKHIGKYWHEGHNIFVVYGSYHAKIQEPVIRDMALTAGGTQAQNS